MSPTTLRGRRAESWVRACQPQPAGSDPPRVNDAPRLNLIHSTQYRDLIDAHFAERVIADRLPFIAGSGWVTRAFLDDAPGILLAHASYSRGESTEALVGFEEGIAHLILQERSLSVRIAADSREAVHAIHARVAHAMPEAGGDELEVPVRFWWWGFGSTRDMARMVPVPAWESVAANYAGSTRVALARMSEWPNPPGGGRLVLWHGDPGTGKTTALRALAASWREWTEFQFVTDPEAFLANPSYLLTTLAPGRGSSGQPSPLDRWRVVVLEDAGEFLAADAKHLKGQALSRLLNVCDGVLGQALRALIVVTTNEPLRTLHPALTRPGRCLVEIEFERFSASESADWCAQRGVAPPPAASSLALADLFAYVEGREVIGPPQRRMGFAA